MKHNNKGDEIIKYCLPIFVGLTLRSIVTLHPYSGKGKAPMYGDFEAQRHWMEIVTNLPSSQWYFNSSDNDLNYWGLDYPPLTAYHSWIMGKWSEFIDPAWTRLYTSRGFESDQHKLFMRYTVLIADLLIFFPAVLFYFYHALPKLSSNPSLTFFYSACLTFMYPGLILIDHGHFQYNCISLGLFLLAVGMFIRDYDVCGAFCFCLALFYKQMELYHALPIFFYLLGKCLNAPFSKGFKHLFKLSLTVILSTLIVFAPFLNSVDSISQVVHRLFPFARGLFEDKVSNFWCATSPFFKWRNLFPQSRLIIICMSVVLTLCSPACLSLLISPNKKKLLYSLASCSLTFYLFSFQVHEKSILLVAIPSLALYPFDPLTSFLFSLTSTLSMWPLMIKDGLALPTTCLLLIYLISGLTVVMRDSKDEHNLYKVHVSSKFVIVAILVGYSVLILASLFFKPPIAYPDLFNLLFAMFSFGQFCIFLLVWLRKAVIA